MTTTSLDERAFLDRIAADPAEDTDRLVYADWLDENGNPDRAEFIRVLVELARLIPEPALSDLMRGGVQNHLETIPPETWRGWRNVAIPLLYRCGDLLTAHETDWRRGPVCRACSNGYVPTDRDDSTCEACRGTGDAGGLMEVVRTEHSDVHASSVWKYPVTFRRGFPEAVRVPRLADVIEEVTCPGCRGYSVGKSAMCLMCNNRGKLWQPTPWAKATMHHPVTAFEVGDRVPYHNGYGHSWFDLSRDRRSLSVPESAEIPSPVFDVMRRHPCNDVGPVRLVDGRFNAYPTPEAARHALARALGAFVRGGAA